MEVEPRVFQGSPECLVIQQISDSNLRFDWMDADPRSPPARILDQPVPRRGRSEDFSDSLRGSTPEPFDLDD